MAGKREGMATTENVEVATLADYIALKEEGFTFKGQSYLFWEYVRLVKELKPKYFVLENVAMTKHWSTIISAAVGVDFTTINSSLLSAQNRKRAYWVAKRTPDGTYTRVNIQQPMSKDILLNDILLEYTPSPLDDEFEVGNRSVTVASFKPSVRGNVINQITDILASTKDFINLKCTSGFNDNKIGLKKSPTVRANNPFTLAKQTNEHGDIIRRLVPRECARLQTIPDAFNLGCLSKSRQYMCIGNGFTINVIAHILKELNDTTTTS